jgi:hypothetical protein
MGRREAIMEKIEEMLKLMRAGDRGVWARLTDTSEAWSIEKGLSGMLLGERTVYADWAPGKCFLWVSEETWNVITAMANDQGVTEGDVADQVIDRLRDRMEQDPETLVATLAETFLRGLQKHDGRYRMTITGSGPHKDAYEVLVSSENWNWLAEEVSSAVCKKAGLKQWKERNPGANDVFGIVVENHFKILNGISEMVTGAE